MQDRKDNIHTHNLVKKLTVNEKERERERAKLFINNNRDDDDA